MGMKTNAGIGPYARHLYRANLRRIKWLWVAWVVTWAYLFVKEVI